MSESCDVIRVIDFILFEKKDEKLFYDDTCCYVVINTKYIIDIIS